jgi:hypothetical protein
VRSDESRWIEVFNRGTKTFDYKVTSDQPWIEITRANGTVEDDAWVEFTAD